MATHQSNYIHEVGLDSWWPRVVPVGERPAYRVEVMLGQSADLWLPILVWLIGVSLCLIWLYFFPNASTTRSLRSAGLIVFRLTMIMVPTFLIMCIGAGVPGWFYAGLAALILLLSLFATHEGVIASHAIDFAIGCTIMIPIYVLKQFVLGFPDRNILAIPPPAEQIERTDLSHLRHSKGTVRATLKPCGTVQIGDSAYSAMTVDGKYLETGAVVEVTGQRNAMLIVVARETERMEPV